MKSFKNTTLSILIVSLMAGPALFLFPAKAKAGITDCIAGMLLSKTKSTGTTVAATTVGSTAMTTASGVATANKITSVPTSDAGVAALIQGQTTAITSLIKADATINSGTNSQTTGLSIKRCIIEPIVTIMARTLLTKFTAQTVNWINSGFQGSPQYVTNIQGFMSDVADQAIGSYIQSLGPIGSIICGPFDLQVRLSLNLQYSKGPNLREGIGCRLSDIQKNVQNAFTKGVFGKSGWNNWLQITQVQQNNPYGAYLKGVESIDAKIAGRQIALKSQLDFGSGFLSSVDPKTGKITTPGAIIEGQLNSTLYQPLQNIGLAKDIDAILTALVGQMISQVMGGIGGLAGASDSRSASGGYSSSVDLGLKQTPTTVSNANNQAQSFQVGLYMNTSVGKTAPTTACPTKTADCPTVTGGPTPTAFCTQFKANVYGTKPNDTRVWVKVNGTGADTLTSKTSATGDVPWTVADYKAVSNFCQFVDITTPINGQVDTFVDQITPKGEVTSPEITPAEPSGNRNADREISLRTAKLNQSYIYMSKEGISYGPDNVFGYTGALTADGPAPHWWTASLNSNEKIQVIKVLSNTKASGNGVHTITLSIVPDNQQGVAVSYNQVQAGQKVFEFTIPTNPSFGSYSIRSGNVEIGTLSGTNNDFTITLTNPISANAIAISRPNYLWLMEVTLSRPQNSVITFSKDVSETLTLSQSAPTTINVGFTTRLDKSLTIKTALQKYDGNGNFVSEALSTIFPSFAASIQQPAKGLQKGPFGVTAMSSGQTFNFFSGSNASVTYAVQPPAANACLGSASLPQYRLITTITADSGESSIQTTPFNISCN